ncbi:hypothetical protein H0274_10955 [Altererythrobacter sp. CC-YST694]|uniref:hypothetical protein n=1 Tax=Altererythrobacter sp. CC-YST694 TaxID=2755038 RepID=UPI001D021DA1|nr:hypothetical protein [Altererythrobacter sp. CC-YST694]MCB5425780.1 hypothetical protein [Altererythrobacter sp. CC-YST694]
MPIGRSQSLLGHDVLPFYLSLLALVAAALLLDALLHLGNAVWIGRYLGIPGTILILVSGRYSLRKHKIVSWGKPAKLLKQHQWLAWIGSLLVLVHAGIHFNAWLGWLAVAAMLINVASGLTGKYLLGRTQKRLANRRRALTDAGLSADDISERTHFDTRTMDLIKQWRVIHVPITLAFAGLALAHIITIFLFWSWK